MVLPAAAPGRAGKALAGRQSRVRLHEVGPRLELEIVKVRVLHRGLDLGFCGCGWVLPGEVVTRQNKHDDDVLWWCGLAQYLLASCSSCKVLLWFTSIDC